MRARVVINLFGLGFMASFALMPSFAHAEASLQVAPQKYQEILSGDTVRNGFIDVSNPSDTGLKLESLVQGFRQADLDGNLEFFDDPVLSAAIKVDLKSFELGPREAVRVSFSVDPTKLPKGGAYGAIFFRTIPPTPTSNTSYIAESAKVGTLLLLENGNGIHVGKITQLSLPFFQFGDGFKAVARYKNSDRNPTAAAFTPELSSKVLFWGRKVPLAGPYVLPQSEREFEIHRTGSYIGILPFSLMDNTSGQVVTRWALICTGWYALALIVLVVFGLVLLVRWLVSRSREKKLVKVKRSFDTLSRKSR